MPNLGKRRREILCAAAAATMLAAAKAPPGAGDAAQRAFVADYVAAVRSHDPARVKATFHPAVQACMDGASRPFFDTLVANELRNADKLSAYRITAVTPVKDAPVIFPLPADGFAYPAPPTHQVQIDAEYGPFKSLTVLRYVARAQGRWFLVYPCPNARGLEAFAHMSAERERRLAEGRRLAAEMAPGLRSELEGLIGKGRLIEAIDRYRAATGADVDTARRAVQALAPAG